MKRIDFFDLDNTIWEMPSKLSVIYKKQPDEIFYTIDKFHIPLMKSYYKKYDILIEYNGDSFFLNKKLWNEIKENCPYECKPEDIGITMRDWSDKDRLENQIKKTRYLIHNIKHLIDVDTNISLLTARGYEENHMKNIEVLEEEIYKAIKKKINKSYFVNSVDSIFNDDISAERKTSTIIEHLIGFRVVDGKFMDIECEPYTDVYFYDDLKINIENAKDIQFLFDRYYLMSDDNIKNEIKQRLENNKLTAVVCHINSNKLEPFKEYVIELILPN